MKLSKQAMQRALRVYRKRPARSKAELLRRDMQREDAWRCEARYAKLIAMDSEVLQARDRAVYRRVNAADINRVIIDAARNAAQPGGVASFPDIVAAIDALQGTPAPLHWAQRNPL